MPNVPINITGNLLEAQGIRNREEAGKRKILATGNADIPMSFFDHDYRMEDNDSVGITNISYHKYVAKMSKYLVVPNYGASATDGTYQTVINPTISFDVGKYFPADYRFKWIYLPDVSTDTTIHVQSNYTCHGTLEYTIGGQYIFTYNNIGNMIPVAGHNFFLVFQDGSAAFPGSEHIFALNQVGSTMVHYGFFQSTGVIGANSISVSPNPLTVQIGPLFNPLDNLLFESNNLPPIVEFGKQCILYDFGYSVRIRDNHLLGVTGFNDIAVNPVANVRSYNDIIMDYQATPTILNAGTVDWQITPGSPDNTQVVMAFLAPIGNFIDFTITGDLEWDSTLAAPPGNVENFTFGPKIAPIGMTQYFGADTLNTYQTILCVNDNVAGTASLIKPKYLNTSFNFKTTIRGLPVFLSRLYANFNGPNVPATKRPGLYDPTSGGVTPPSITLNSIDCRRRI